MATPLPCIPSHGSLRLFRSQSYGARYEERARAQSAEAEARAHSAPGTAPRHRPPAPPERRAHTLLYRINSTTDYDFYLHTAHSLISLCISRLSLYVSLVAVVVLSVICPRICPVASGRSARRRGAWGERGGAPAVRLRACAAAPRGARGAERGCLHSQRSFWLCACAREPGSHRRSPGAVAQGLATRRFAP